MQTTKRSYFGLRSHAHRTAQLLFLMMVMQVSWLTASEQRTLTTSAADATLNQNFIYTNYGSCSTFTVLRSRASRPTQNQRAVLRFDLTSLSAGVAVKASSVSLYLSSINNGGNRTHELHRVTNTTNAWSEGTGNCTGANFRGVSWTTTDSSTYWANQGGDFDSTMAASANTGNKVGWIVFGPMLSDSTTNFVQGWINDSSSNMGFLIKDGAESSGTSSITAKYNSHSNPSNTPRMDITYLRDVTMAPPTANVSSVTLGWTFPSGTNASNYDGLLISLQQGAAVPNTVPADGTSYPAGTALSSTELVAVNTAVFDTVSATLENGPSLVLLPGSQFTFKAFAHDSSTIPGAASVVPPHYSTGVATSTVTLPTGGGTVKNWSYKMAYATLAAPALAPGGEVLGSGNDGILHSMSASTGARQYIPGTTAGTAGYMGAAVQSIFSVIPSQYLEPATLSVFGGNCQLGSCDVAFMGAQDGTVWAFNVRTGAKLWQSPVLTNSGGAIVGSPVIQLRTFANSTFRNTHTSYDLLVVGTHNSGDARGNKVYGLRSDTGQIVWTFAPGNMDQVNGRAMIDYASNTVWAASLSNGNTQPSLWKLNTLNGQSLAAITLPTANKDVGGSPTLNFNSAAPYLYLVTAAGDVVAINTSSNAVTVGPNYGSGLVKYAFALRNSSNTGDEIYFSNSSGINKVLFTYASHAFSPGWSNNAIVSPSTPVLNGPTPTALYVGSSDGNLYKLDVSNGTQTDYRSVNPGKYIGDASVDVQLSKIYVGDSSGRIYSYDLF